MKKTQYSTNYLVLTIFLVLASFVFFQPKLSAKIFSNKRSAYLNNLITDIRYQKTVPPRKFWEFREFYYPGYITVNKEGLTQQEVHNQLKTMRIELVSTPSANTHFMIYKSDKLNSLESLVAAADLTDVVKVDLKDKQVILQNPKELVYYDTDKSVVIAFLKAANDDMVKTNGYFDYRNKRDILIYEGKWWLSVSRILTP